jgi:hypothetical protein
VRSRRTSLSLAAASASEDEVAALEMPARMAVQKEAGAEVGSWGVGDEVRMGLE